MEYIGRHCIRRFESETVEVAIGTVDAFLPARAKDEEDLWQITHTDGDSEELDIEELKQALFEETKTGFGNDGRFQMPKKLVSALLEVLEKTEFKARDMELACENEKKPKRKIRRLVLGYTRMEYSTLPAFVSGDTMKHLALYKLLRATIQLFAPQSFAWTTCQVNKNFPATVHQHRNNGGQSCVSVICDLDALRAGGGVFVRENKKIKCQGGLVLFDGQRPHGAVNVNSGNR
jgi:hypothetical protein